MDKRSRILLIVEGERTERRLFQQLFTEYGLTLEYDIYAYRTNIHDLYERMFSSHDADDLDLLGVLSERETDPIRKELLHKNYSDTLLVFDYDPHDNRFSPDALARMMSFFDESTERGKLYINYPMVESYKHVASLDDPNFYSKEIPVEKLSRYKELVDRESFCTDVSRIAKKDFDAIIRLSILKAHYLLRDSMPPTADENTYQSCSHTELLARQNELVRTKRRVSVLPTCLFFICDYSFELICTANDAR